MNESRRPRAIKDRCAVGGRTQPDEAAAHDADGVETRRLSVPFRIPLELFSVYSYSTPSTLLFPRGKGKTPGADTPHPDESSSNPDTNASDAPRHLPDVHRRYSYPSKYTSYFESSQRALACYLCWPPQPLEGNPFPDNIRCRPSYSVRSFAKRKSWFHLQ